MVYKVTLDSGSNETDNLLRGTKSMIIYGSDVRCFPHGSIKEGDILYFTGDENPSVTKARGIVSSVFNSCRLSVEESYEIVIKNQDKLQLPDDQFYKYAGKRYLIMIGVTDMEEIKQPNVRRNNSPVINEWSLSGILKDITMPDLRIA